VFESEILIAAGEIGVTSVAVAIPGIYPLAARASHFRPVADIVRIVLMVAGRLLRHGMHPAGLWRSLDRPMAVQDVPDSALAGGMPGGDLPSRAG
jgi:hypothetical protein